MGSCSTAPGGGGFVLAEPVVLVRGGVLVVGDHQVAVAGAVDPVDAAPEPQGAVAPDADLDGLARP